jgi:hypothetical protein
MATGVLPEATHDQQTEVALPLESVNDYREAHLNVVYGLEYSPLERKLSLPPRQLVATDELAPTRLAAPRRVRAWMRRTG